MVRGQGTTDLTLKRVHASAAIEKAKCCLINFSIS